MTYRRLPDTSAPASVERKMGMVIAYDGPRRVSVRFVDGMVYAMPSEPFSKLALAPNERFVMITTFAGRQVRDVRIERAPEPRPQIAGRPLPKVMVRDGLKVSTRR